MQKYLTDVLGERKGAFMNNITALVNNNPSLHSCKPMELIYGAMKATALELPFDGNLGFAYLIPYKDGKTGEVHAQFQIGYKGFIQLAIRSGQFATINVRDVREGEIVGEDFVSGELIFKAAADRENLPVVGYLAYMRLVNGFQKMLYMTKEQLEKHAATYSQTYRSNYTKSRSKWATDFEAMAKKTCLKLLLSKYAPMAVEMPQLTTAIQSDQSVVTSGGYDYIDNQLEQDAAQEASEAEAIAEAKATEVAKKISDNKARIKQARAEAMKKANEPEPQPAASVFPEDETEPLAMED